MTDPQSTPLLVNVAKALKALHSGGLQESATTLFGALGYSSRKTIDLDGRPESFLDLIDPEGKLASKLADRVADWTEAQFVFQLTNDELPTLAAGQQTLQCEQENYRKSIIESFVFIAIELRPAEWTRSELVGITRELNQQFPMPALVLFRHGDLASFAVIDRRPNKKDSTRDVIEKRISIIKDIDLRRPHRGHLEILCDIALSKVGAKIRGKGTPTNFRDLYDAWIEALSAQTLNKKFYEQLAHWYFWSVRQVIFPTASLESDEEKRLEQNQIAVIRLLTRLIFVWFIKEKKLVPDELFDPLALRQILDEDPAAEPESGTYYKTILQNLFFATLNTEMSDERKWRSKAPGGGLDGQYLVHNVYRFHEAFRDPDRALGLFRQVPFLNGGLFECLDREISDKELGRNPDLNRWLVREGNRNVIRIDGFSERPANPLHVPNKIFFARDEPVDLNDDFDTRGKSYKADGLIELFSRYKFTIEENTPAEEEVALDPELLGKVFENLLASYNADTRTTARKKSGSFYTPREVVDYMVDEALIACLERALAPGLDFGTMPGELDLVRAPTEPKSETNDPKSIDARLRDLLSYKLSGNPFSEPETDDLIAAIDSLKALDPACGSGAFPMGLLQKLVHVLKRLDPDNARWKTRNRRPLEIRLTAARSTPDPARRDTEIEEAEAALEKFEKDFADPERPDYARKLYLIDKCLYGVDLQPIAVQIAKLRFFISLVVSQKVDRTQPNANITALPNLETRLVAANSLMPIIRPETVDLFRNPAIALKEAELREANERYFSARTVRTKRKYRDRIGALRDELAILLRDGRGLAEVDAIKMAAWDPFDQNRAASFFDPEWMFGMEGLFDLVIGNPPYVRQEAIKDQKERLKQFYDGGKDVKGWIKGSYAGTADLLVYFIQRGIELLNQQGAFAFITSNKWYRAKYGVRLRGWLNNQVIMRRIIDFGDAEVFDAIAYPTIFVATRRAARVQQPDAADIVQVMNWPPDLGKDDIETFPELFGTTSFRIAQKELLDTGWQLEPQIKRNLLDRIRAAGMPLSQYVEGKFYYGIKTGFNEAFVIDGATKDRLIAEHASSAQIIKPFLRGRDIKRWRVEPQDLWLIRIESSENKTHPWSKLPDQEAEALFAETYPAIHCFMSAYRKELIKRSDQGQYFWELRSCTYWEAFEGPKIIVPAISDQPNAARDLDGHYTNNKATIFVTKAPWLALASMNSPVGCWFARQTFATKQGGFFDFEPRYSGTFPIPRSSTVESRSVETISKSVETLSDSRFEQLLNGFIYELFFREDLHARGLILFDEAEKSGLGALASLGGAVLITAATEFADRVFAPSHPLYAMLFELQDLEMVRIIEGKA